MYSLFYTFPFLFFFSDSCIPVYLALTEAGKEFGMVNAGYRAIDSLSIEKGYPHWHQEVVLIQRNCELQ